jgi:hypothetical protein
MDVGNLGKRGRPCSMRPTLSGLGTIESEATFIAYSRG